ncbi:hypothetical protein ITJ64_05625 [Herbiconiux sp. VKM Ac-1786]|jgi:hypothetical protein|uniref:hypothetical protein n=1 Tax=Herbiconiux sp. VKM Ac-1786 TaxID=2783824 RepID=UPI00188A33D7|nr:hypothetical protein [Herbiconiux sp. VKM Ac-1786]MBF4571991.1 hypothetical protein [Herbiconiux sp. VKM Ac-1786]
MVTLGLTTPAPAPGSPSAAAPARTTRCEHCGDVVDQGGSFCSDEHAAAWLETPFG